MSDLIKRNSPQSISYSGLHTDFGGSDHSEERLEARLFIHRLLKRKYQILAFILAVMIPTAIITFFTTPLYRSSALIQINPDPVQILPFREIGDLPNSAPYYEVYMKTQEQILRSLLIWALPMYRKAGIYSGPCLYMKILNWAVT